MTKAPRSRTIAAYMLVVFGACHYDGCTLEWKGCEPINLVPLDLAPSHTDGGDKGPGTLGKAGEYRFVGEPTAADPTARELHPVAKLGRQTIRYTRSSASPTVEKITVSGGISATGNATIAQVKGFTPPGGDLELRLKDGQLIDSVFVPVVGGVASRLIDGNVSGRPGAVWREGEVALRVALSAGSDDVVDDTLTLDVTGGSALPEAWYHHRIVPSADAAAIHVAVKGDGFFGTAIDYAVVDTIDGLAATGDEPLTAGLLGAGEILALCPYATSGDFEIVGASPTLIASGAVLVTPHEGSYDSCVTLEANGVGVGEVVLALGGRTRRYVFFVGSADLGIDLGVVPDDLGGSGSD